MVKRSFCKRDWLFGWLVALVFMFGTGSNLLQSPERKVRDLGVPASSRMPSDKVTVVAKLVDHTASLFDLQVDVGLIYIHKIAEGHRFQYRAHHRHKQDQNRQDTRHTLLYVA